MEYYILKMILVVIGFLQYILNRIAATKTYNAYYARKRREFPWLDNWIKEKGINPASTRGNSAANTPLIGVVIAYFGIALVGGIVLNFIIRSLYTMIALGAGANPSGIVDAIFFNVGQVIAIIIGVLVSQHIWNEKIKKPSDEGQITGLTLECPKCHCPHAWVELFSQRTVEGKSRTTTTTTYVRESDGATKRTESSKEYYYGTAIKDFKCLNCNHTHHGEYHETWDDTRPNEKPVYYDPPLPAWKPTKGTLSNIINVVLIIAMFTLAKNYITGYVNYLKYDTQKVTAGKGTVQIAQIVRTVGEREYTEGGTLTLLDEPKPNANEVKRIPAGDFVTVTGKTVKKLGNEFVPISHNGTNGWLNKKYLVILPKDLVIEAWNDTKLLTDSWADAKVIKVIKKKEKIIIIGEIKGSFIQVKHGEDTGWILTTGFEWSSVD